MGVRVPHVSARCARDHGALQRPAHRLAALVRFANGGFATSWALFDLRSRGLAPVAMLFSWANQAGARQPTWRRPANGVSVAICPTIKPILVHFHRGFDEIHFVLDGWIHIETYDPETASHANWARVLMIPA